MTSSGDLPAKGGALAIVERLARALSTDGDFPTTARMVTEIFELSRDPKTTTQQLADSLRRDPALANKVLGLVNSAYFHRGRSAPSLSQAVVQLGMETISSICSSVVLMQRFAPMVKHGEAFTHQIRSTLITSLFCHLLSGRLYKAAADTSWRPRELGYLYGLFSEIGPLLVALYFPKLFEEATALGESKIYTFSDAFGAMVGISPLETSLHLVNRLTLPIEYADALELLLKDEGGTLRLLSSRPSPAQYAAQVIYISQQVSVLLSAKRCNPEMLRSGINTLPKFKGITPIHIGLALRDLPTHFAEYARSVGIDIRPIPDFVRHLTFIESLTPEKESTHGAPAPERKGPGVPIVKADPTPRSAPTDPFLRAVEAVKAGVISREPTPSILTSSMEALRWGLRLDRVVLLTWDKPLKLLRGRMILSSDTTIEVDKIQLKEDTNNIVGEAIRTRRPLFAGESLLKGGWPLVAVPVGFDGRCIGVIYGDCIESTKRTTFDLREQAGIGMLAEHLDEALKQAENPRARKVQ